MPGELDAVDRPSPSFGERRGGAVPDLVVLHYTAMESCEAARARLCDPAVEVSAHYLVSETGELFRLVPEEKRAWHAGAGNWGNVRDVNSRSIGIELANTGFEPFPERQMEVLERLLADVTARHSIPPERVIGHSDMAPGRKRDPGPRFGWQRLARAGLSVWPEADGPDAVEERSFLEDAMRFGYVPPPGCPDPEAVILEAFRLRFRPGARGGPEAADRAMMRDLAERYPCARA